MLDWSVLIGLFCLNRGNCDVISRDTFVIVTRFFVVFNNCRRNKLSYTSALTVWQNCIYKFVAGVWRLIFLSYIRKQIGGTIQSVIVLLLTLQFWLVVVFVLELCCFLRAHFQVHCEVVDFYWLNRWYTFYVDFYTHWVQHLLDIEDSYWSTLRYLTNVDFYSRRIVRHTGSSQTEKISNCSWCAFHFLLTLSIDSLSITASCDHCYTEDHLISHAEHS